MPPTAGCKGTKSSRLVATAAVAADRPVVARYWLRHAAATAPDASRRAAALTALDQLRAATRWSLRLNLGIQPSSNVNAGAASRFNEIEGIPIVGVLSEDAMALPGTIGTLDARLGYRLNVDPKNRTEVSLRFDLRAVELRGAPTVSSWTPAEGWVETRNPQQRLWIGLGRVRAGAYPRRQLGAAQHRAGPCGRARLVGGRDCLRLSAPRAPT